MVPNYISMPDMPCEEEDNQNPTKTKANLEVIAPAVFKKLIEIENSKFDDYNKFDFKESLDNKKNRKRILHSG